MERIQVEPVQRLSDRHELRGAVSECASLGRHGGVVHVRLAHGMPKLCHAGIGRDYRVEQRAESNRDPRRSLTLSVQPTSILGCRRARACDFRINRTPPFVRSRSHMTEFRNQAKGLARAGSQLRSRTYFDDAGVRWHVYELPLSEYDRRSGASLIFDSDASMRRVRNFPDNWDMLSDAELASLSWMT